MDIKTTHNTVHHHPHKNKVHHILAHSYSFFFLLLIIGILLDVIFNVKFFENSILLPVGFVLLVLASILIFWAQKSSHKLNKENLSKETFCRGPYYYTRSPTHLGLFLLILSFGFITNAFFVIVLTVVSFIVTKFVFVKKQEAILEERYGEAYKEYKKSVKI
jgi:protein-S-isoprenylcysteine O-methyltransferase Ste14